MTYIKKKGQPTWRFAAFFIVAATFLPGVMFYTTLEKMMETGSSSTLGAQTEILQSAPTPTPTL